MSRIGIETVLSMDVRLGYTHDVDKLHANWTEVARSTEDRPLHCTANKVSTHLVYTQPTHTVSLVHLVYTQPTHTHTLSLAHLVYTQPTHTHTLSSTPSVHTAHPCCLSGCDSNITNDRPLHCTASRVCLLYTSPSPRD